MSRTRNGERKSLAPERVLRRAGVLGVLAGVAIIAVAVVGATVFTPTNANDAAATSSAAHGVVFLFAIAVLGIIEVIAGVFGLVAAARFPHVAKLAGPNEFLPFLAGFVTFVCAIGLSVLNAGLFAVIVVAVFAVVVATTYVTRHAIATGEQPTSDAV